MFTRRQWWGWGVGLTVGALCVATVAYGLSVGLPRGTHGAGAAWGVQLEGLQPIAGGYALSLRLRVIDAAKARVLLDEKTDPTALHVRSQTRLTVPHPPRFGALRSHTRTVVADQLHFVIFANPQRLVVPGDHVLVTWGAMQLDSVVGQ